MYLISFSSKLVTFTKFSVPFVPSFQNALFDIGTNFSKSTNANDSIRLRTELQENRTIISRTNLQKG